LQEGDSVSCILGSIDYVDLFGNGIAFKHEYIKKFCLLEKIEEKKEGNEVNLTENKQEIEKIEEKKDNKIEINENIDPNDKKRKTRDNDKFEENNIYFSRSKKLNKKIEIEEKKPISKDELFIKKYGIEEFENLKKQKVEIEENEKKLESEFEEFFNLYSSIGKNCSEEFFLGFKEAIEILEKKLND
jgi:hypothetical protein